MSRRAIASVAAAALRGRPRLLAPRSRTSRRAAPATASPCRRPRGPRRLAPAAPGRLAVSPGAILGGRCMVAGTLGGAAGAPVVVEQSDPSAGWMAVATAPADAAGALPRDLGAEPHRAVHAARAVVADDAQASAASAAALTGDVTVFRPAKATWYGPGFFGRRTACRRRMTRSLRGVAHKTLPCGTPVDVFYAGRTVRVPVVDRGPFENGAQWDLTQRTAQDLGIDRDRADRRRAPARRGDRPQPLAAASGLRRPDAGGARREDALVRAGDERLRGQAVVRARPRRRSRR